MADKTIGALDEAKIGDLPAASGTYDETLIPVEQQGEAKHMTGRQWKAYVLQGISAGGGSGGGTGSGEDNPDMVTASGGAELLLPAILGQGPYEIEFVLGDSEEPVTTYTVTTDVDPSVGGTITGAGTYESGTEVTVTATPADGYEFVKLLGYKSHTGSFTHYVSSYTFTIEDDVEVTAYFNEAAVPNFDVSLEVDPAAAGTVTGAGRYASGEEATVTATAASGYTFDYWIVRNAGSSGSGTIIRTNPYTFSVEKSVDITAIFNTAAVQRHTVTLAVDPSGSSTVTGAGSYESGASATIKATVASGYKFVGWNDGGATKSTNPTYTFTVTKDVTFTAVSRAEPTVSSGTATLPASADWSGITYGNGKFAIISGLESANNIVVYSSDGKNWSETTLPYSYFWTGIAYGNNLFVAVNQSCNDILYSSDLKTWKLAGTPSEFGYNSIAFGNNTFVAMPAGANKAVYSYDGKEWLEAALPAYGNWGAVTYGNGKFVAVNQTSNQAVYSADGKTWTSATLPSEGWRGVAFGNGKFVAVGPGKAAYSTDGANWTASAMNDPYLRGIAYGNGKFVAVSSTSKKVYYSTDAVNWETGEWLDGQEQWVGVAYGGKKFVVIPYKSSTVGYIEEP